MHSLQATEKDGVTELFALEGVVLQTDTYMSASNELTLQFTTDSSTNQNGWKLFWEEVVPTTTTTSTTTVTTTPAGNC